jgi:hypothetical protein
MVPRDREPHEQEPGMSNVSSSGFHPANAPFGSSGDAPGATPLPNRFPTVFGRLSTVPKRRKTPSFRHFIDVGRQEHRQ